MERRVYTCDHPHHQLYLPTSYRYKNTRCMPNILTNLNTPRHKIPVGTMVYCFYVNILRNNIRLLCLCLHSVYRLLCLSFAVMFLVCGDGVQMSKSPWSKAQPLNNKIIKSPIIVIQLPNYHLGII